MIQVVLCIIIVPGLMIKEPPQFKTSLRACAHHTPSWCMFNDSNFQRAVLPIDRYIDHSIAPKSQQVETG